MTAYLCAKKNITYMEEITHFSGETMVLNRSQINPAAYNPRRISAEARKTLKRSIKRYGVVGGIVVNSQTNYTIVGGHQKVSILDELNKYDENDPSTDYQIKCEVVDVDLKTEKSMNIMLNNASATGQWDWDALAAVVPDIDYKDAGLTEADLSMIGLDYLYKTEGQSDTADALKDLMSPVEEAHQQELAQRAEERAAIKEANKIAAEQAEQLAQQEMTREDRVQHMKEVKQQVREQAVENAKNMDAYLVLSFDTFNAKAAFCQKYGFGDFDRMIKGEDFDARAMPMEDDSFDEEDYE